MTRTPDSSPKLYNASPEVAKYFVEVMKRFQDVGRDLETLRAFLSEPFVNKDVGVRVLGCLLDVSVLSEVLVRLQIVTMSEEERK